MSKPLNAAQVTARDAYAGGDFNHCLDMDDVEKVGDTLFRFIMIELSDDECLENEEAINRMENARSDIENVIRALEKGIY